MINLHNIDCMEFMRNIPDKHYDLAIVDPPYGIDAINKIYAGREGYVGSSGTLKGFNGREGGKVPPRASHILKDWDKKPYKIEQWNELKRVSKKQIVWGCNYYESFFNSGGRIVWDKLTFDSDFGDGEIAFYSGHNKVDIIYLLNNGMLKGANASRDPRIAIKSQINPQEQSKSKRIHPTQKPVALYKWLLDKYAKQGDKILDTHGGSMSIAIACHDYGFDLDLCELDKDYFEAGKKRLEYHMLQTKLF